MKNNNNLLTNKEYINCMDDNPSKQELSKYITNKYITNEIIIEIYDNNLNIPYNIIYDNHKYILTSKNPEICNKNTYRCSLWGRIKGKTKTEYSFCYSKIACKI